VEEGGVVGAIFVVEIGGVDDSGGEVVVLGGGVGPP
jgi:hypothetical protein